MTKFYFVSGINKRKNVWSCQQICCAWVLQLNIIPRSDIAKLKVMGRLSVFVLKLVSPVSSFSCTRCNLPPCRGLPFGRLLLLSLDWSTFLPRPSFLFDVKLST